MPVPQSPGVARKWHDGRMRIPPLLVSGAAVTATAMAGAAATDPESDWYQSLDRPDWQPPPAAFPIVWTTLYATIAGAVAKAYNSAPEEERAALVRQVAVNLSLNAGWSWLFFRSRHLWVATFGAAALAISSLKLVKRAGRHSRAAGAWLVPYALWTCFATVLSADIAARNPQS